MCLRCLLIGLLHLCVLYLVLLPYLLMALLPCAVLQLMRDGKSKEEEVHSRCDEKLLSCAICSSVKKACRCGGFRTDFFFSIQFHSGHPGSCESR
ncbi:hypothetical protein GE21DRAFT_1097906 [Neurospora crassa]|nr:hypothetical protein GE21DRAFT_1097906 [Neurospora crassa]